MPIPQTRSELVDSVRVTFKKLTDELDAAGPRIGNLHCVEDWSVKDLLIVRTWWTERVAEWVEAGMRGECPETPAVGYSWKETPRLNAEIVKQHRRESFKSVRQRLDNGCEKVLAVIDALDDNELLDVGIFEWAGRYPIARWISLNTTRQYTTARTFIRRAIRNKT